MKNNKLIITAIAFFILVNINYFIEKFLDLYAFPFFLFLGLIFLILFVLLVYNIIILIYEKFKNRNRLISISVVTVVLITAFYFPVGIYNAKNDNRNEILVASREGAANCMTTFKLLTNNNFSERNVCFSVTKTTGKYEIINDTIFFHDVILGRHDEEFYEFALIKPNSYDSTSMSVFRYKNKQDTIGSEIWISKNKLHAI